MKDEYIEKLAAIAYCLADAAKELNGAIEWYAADIKTLYQPSEKRAWEALDTALTIIKNDKPEVLQLLTSLCENKSSGDTP